MRDTTSKTRRAATRLGPVQFRQQPLQQHFAKEGDGGGTGDSGDGGNAGGSGSGDDSGDAGNGGDDGGGQSDAAAKRAAAASAKAAAKALKDAEKRAADAEAALEEERNKTRTDDEKAAAESRKQAVTEAVTAKEVELSDHYETRLAAYRDDIIDGVIDTALATAGRERKEYETVIATLDKQKFVDDDGNVKKDEVARWATELTGPSSSRPPRTAGTTRANLSDNRGFGRYLTDQTN